MSVGFVNRNRWAISGVAVAAPNSTPVALLFGRSALPSDIADGYYSNDCCGTVELRGGRLIANGVELVRYTVGQDDQGPYILPRTFVGTQDTGIIMDGAQPVLKLRLNALPSPSRISLPGLRHPDNFERTVRLAR